MFFAHEEIALIQTTIYFYRNSSEKALLKGSLSGLSQVLAIESSLKMMKMFLFHLKGSSRSPEF